MNTRVNVVENGKGAMNAMLTFSGYAEKSGLEHSLLNLVYFRVSQINGCAYCLDMHWKDLRAIGETEQRMYSLDAWEESPYYTDRERAALAWTEAVTKICETHGPDEVYEGVRKQFSEKDIANLTLTIATINLWNRLAISMRAVPGRYQPAKRQEFREGARADAV